MNGLLIKNLNSIDADYCATYPADVVGFCKKAAAALDAQEWQPIETAPKDGTRIIMWATLSKANFGNKLTRPLFDGVFVGYYLADSWQTGGFNMVETARGWMPLPKMPKEQS